MNVQNLIRLMPPSGFSGSLRAERLYRFLGNVVNDHFVTIGYHIHLVTRRNDLQTALSTYESADRLPRRSANCFQSPRCRNAQIAVPARPCAFAFHLKIRTVDYHFVGN